jgi:SAM-dependent methyltransferase
MDARAIPFEREFDVVGAFDVLEHVEEDEAVIAQVWRALLPDGVFLITVPQHMFLWSKQDDYACHVRRYEASELRSKLARAGFKVSYLTSFVSLLLPILFLSRVRKRGAGQLDATDEARLPAPVNSVLAAIMRIEGALIGAGLRFPAGGSLLAVATKVQ